MLHCNFFANLSLSRKPSSNNSLLLEPSRQSQERESNGAVGGQNGGTTTTELEARNVESGRKWMAARINYSVFATLDVVSQSSSIAFSQIKHDRHTKGTYMPWSEPLLLSGLERFSVSIYSVNPL
jgi:hypothetical protein